VERACGTLRICRRYAEGRRALDAGCGTGYGSAELAQSAITVTRLDVVPEAAEFARAAYPIPNMHFVVSSWAGMPFQGCRR
jgi:methylase of polypeptide subunit release factors